MDFPTFDDFVRRAKTELLTRNRRLTREVVDNPATDAGAMVAAIASAGDMIVGHLVRVTARQFLDSCRGVDLDSYAFSRFGLTRKAASPARGSVEFSTTTATVSAFSIPADTVLSTPDGRQYVVTAATTFPSGSTGPVVASIRSVNAGLAQQASAGTITSIVSPVVGSPAGLRVTNPLATAGADEQESDDAFRERVRLFFTTSQRGTIKALQAAALGVPGVRTATAFEQLDTFGRPSRGVELCVSDAFTEQLLTVSPTPLAYQTQSQVLAAAVFTALNEWRAAGVQVTVRVASVALQGITLALRFAAGADVESTAYRARSAIVVAINRLAPGSSLLRSDLITALRTVSGLVVQGDEIYSPAGDVIASPLQVIRTSLALVTPVGLQPDRVLANTTAVDS